MTETEESPVLHCGLGPPTKCRSCPTMIVFARHGTTGKNQPFELDAAGVWVIENGVARHVGTPDVQLEFGAAPGEAKALRYTSHFARCPAADQWRRK